MHNKSAILFVLLISLCVNLGLGFSLGENEDILDQTIRAKTRQYKLLNERSRQVVALRISNGELKKNVNKLDEKAQDLQIQLMSLGKSDQAGKERVAYLTFDDGPSNVTANILNTLKRYDAKATFFVCGNTTLYGKYLYKRIVSEGHTIGNHTFSHDYSYIYDSVENFEHDFKRLEKLLIETIGVKPIMARFPGGSNNTVSYNYGGRSMMDRLSNYAKNQGYYCVDWNIDSKDATGVNYTAEQIANNVLSNVRGRDRIIILMHDSHNKFTTAAAVPIIIKRLKGRGYRFEPLTPSSYSIEF